jgi:hypothetical protein
VLSGQLHFKRRRQKEMQNRGKLVLTVLTVMAAFAALMVVFRARISGGAPATPPPAAPRPAGTS